MTGRVATRLILVATDGIPPDLLDGLAAVLAREWRRPVDRGPSLPVPAAPDARRGAQVMAHAFLAALRSLGFPDDRLVLAVTEQDITAPIMQYVLGEAELGGRFGVISTARIQGDAVATRLAKLAVHEVGHLHGLVHCRDPGCAMFPVLDTVELDCRGMGLCYYCAFDLQSRIRS